MFKVMISRDLQPRLLYPTKLSFRMKGQIRKLKKFIITKPLLSFFCCPNPHWFLQPEVMGIYLPGTGTLGYVVWPGAGITCC